MCVRWKWGLSISLGTGWVDQRTEGIETSVWSLHWAEITSAVGGCKMQRSPGRHQTGFTGGFSNLTIVSKGLFFGLLSHYAVMVAIFCFGIWIFFFFFLVGGWGGWWGHARKFLNQASLTTNLLKVLDYSLRLFRWCSQLLSGSRVKNVCVHWGADIKY